MMNRRSLLLGLAGVLAAPAVVRSGILMPVKRIITPVPIVFGRVGVGDWLRYSDDGGYLVPVEFSTQIMEMLKRDLTIPAPLLRA